MIDIYAAYMTWPADIRKKLSVHDLRRMTGWAPVTEWVLVPRVPTAEMMRAAQDNEEYRESSDGAYRTYVAMVRAAPAPIDSCGNPCCERCNTSPEFRGDEPHAGAPT